MAGDVPGGAGSPSDRQVSPRAAAAAEAAVNNARKRLDFEDESGMVPAVSAASAAALLAGKDSVVCEDSPERPAFSYARLTAMAIDASPDKRCTVAAIYTWIMDRFPYYRQGKPWWKNCIRHNLSMKKCFLRIEGTNLWAIDPTRHEDVLAPESRSIGRKRRDSGSTPARAPRAVSAAAAAAVPSLGPTAALDRKRAPNCLPVDDKEDDNDSDSDNVTPEPVAPPAKRTARARRLSDAETLELPGADTRNSPHTYSDAGSCSAATDAGYAAVSLAHPDLGEELDAMFLPATETPLWGGSGSGGGALWDMPCTSSLTLGVDSLMPQQPELHSLGSRALDGFSILGDLSSPWLPDYVWA